jgi:hypothetical protein
MTFLEQAVEALTRLPDTVEHAVLHIDLVCRDLSDPLNIRGRYERLLEHMRDAARLAEKIGDRARLASALARTLHALRTCGQLDRAVEIGERACGLADEIGDPQLTAFSRSLELQIKKHWRTYRPQIIRELERIPEPRPRESPML